MSEANKDLARKINSWANRYVSINALLAYLQPRMAKDAGIDFAKVFKDVPVGPGFKKMKPEIAKRIRGQLPKAKLAMDASLDDVEKVLDMLDGHEIDGGVDESVSEAQHNAMGAAAGGGSKLGIPESVGKEFMKADTKSGKDALGEYLRGKGMGEDGVNGAVGLIERPTGRDEDLTGEEKKKKEEEEKKAADEKGEQEEMARRIKEKEGKAMDERLKGMVSKQAMDEALKKERTESRNIERGIRKALEDVRPWTGDIAVEKTLTMDSAADVHRHALTMLEVPGVDVAKTHADALLPIIQAQPKPGAARHVNDDEPRLGMDAAGSETFSKDFPDAGRIRPA